MLSRKGRRALLGIIENVEAAQDFLSGRDVDDFSGNRQCVYAVTCCLEISSEASRRLDEATRERHPHIPWRQIANAGNIYRHDYDSVSPRVIWRTVHESLPQLLIICMAELAQFPDELMMSAKFLFDCSGANAR